MSISSLDMDLVVLIEQSLRASLYRIICDLEEKGIIKKEGKQIFIKNINGL